MTDTTVATLIAGVLTGSTCGDACWHAVEDVCRCSCGGHNHGILTRGGHRPQRTCRIAGEFFELAAIIPGPSGDECWADAYRRVRDEFVRIAAERFPGVDANAYGTYRPGTTFPVVDRKVTGTQAKWPEVQAIPGACRLVWARPAGSRYFVRNPDATAEQRAHGLFWTLAPFPTSI